MDGTADRRFGWVAALALASGIAVLVPSITVAAVSVLTVLAMIF